MKIWVLTIFPDYFPPFLANGVAGQALKGQRGSDFELKIVNIRDYGKGNYKSVDDTPYGGGPGMIMTAPVLKDALMKGVVEAGAYGDDFKSKIHVIYPSPRGPQWNALRCREFATTRLLGEKDLVFIAGRYEGIDERFLENYVDEHISVGDYVLTGGELAIMTILDSALRFVPGVLGNADGAQQESFEGNLLEHPQYTKPREFEGVEVPEVLASGHHANMVKWQNDQRMIMTKRFRPDLLEKKK